MSPQGAAAVSGGGVGWGAREGSGVPQGITGVPRGVTGILQGGIGAPGGCTGDIGILHGVLRSQGVSGVSGGVLGSYKES